MLNINEKRKKQKKFIWLQQKSVFFQGNVWFWKMLTNGSTSAIIASMQEKLQKENFYLICS